MCNLENLKNKKDDILKAELAAWLHDWKKCSDEHIENLLDPKVQGLPNKDFTGEFFPKIGNLIVNIHNTTKTISNLVSEGRRGKDDASLPYLIWLLRRCHHSAHIEKEKEEKELEGIQHTKTPRLSSSFGFEGTLVNNLTQLMRTDGPNISSREDIFATKFLRLSPGDTRRPINEVTLWDWSSIVAALYKAEIARFILTGEERTPKTVKWRLLSVRVNGLDFLFSSYSIPDILAREDLLREVWDEIKELLEETYPLGLEVYRDENGTVFVVPDLPNLLNLENSELRTLKDLILGKFIIGNLEGEVLPEIKLDKDPWWGQDPEWHEKIKEGKPTQDEIPPISDHVSESVQNKSHYGIFLEKWKNLPKPTERCVICGLRPAISDKQKICNVCKERKEKRAQKWAEGLTLLTRERDEKNIPETIWLGEVADENGRIALIVGRFDLRNWLTGDLVRSLAVRDPEQVKDKTKTEDVAKNPSFARLRRIWETTKKFWEDVKNQTLPDKTKEKEKRTRIFIEIKDKSKTCLGLYHAYEADINGQKVDVLWDPNRNRLWVIENLEYIKKRFNRDLEDILKETSILEIYEPAEYGKQREFVATTKIEEVQRDTTYNPYISILTEPQTFMAIVPAERAFDVVKAIKTKYEREMGKVRNRLPIHIGVIYAGRKTPLRAIMDAGKRILKQKWNNKPWNVICPARKLIEKGDKLPERFKEDERSQFKEWYEILISQGNRELVWYVPAVMGDGETEDKWYPYVFLVQEHEPKDRARYYRGVNPWEPNHPWLVHVGELQPGDKIYFTPATFDFEFLDSTARRFEIYYENSVRKGRISRPYLLDEVEILEKIWKTVSKEGGEPYLAIAQIIELRDLIEQKRTEWFKDIKDSLNDETFKRFCRDVFVDANWINKGENNINFDFLAKMAVKGYFSDAVELYHHIMKVDEKDKNSKSEVINEH